MKRNRCGDLATSVRKFLGMPTKINAAPEVFVQHTLVSIPAVAHHVVRID